MTIIVLGVVLMLNEMVLYACTVARHLTEHGMEFYLIVLIIDEME